MTTTASEAGYSPVEVTWEDYRTHVGAPSELHLVLRADDRDLNRIWTSLRKSRRWRLFCGEDRIAMKREGRIFSRDAVPTDDWLLRKPAEEVEEDERRTRPRYKPVVPHGGHEERPRALRRAL